MVLGRSRVLLFSSFSRQIWGQRSLHPYQPARWYYVKPKNKSTGWSQAWLAMAGVTLTIAGGGLYVLGKPEEQIVGLNTEEDKYSNNMILMAYLKRAKDRVTQFKKNYTEPSSEKLLPDHLPYPYQRPYTLIMDLNDVLIHSEYDRKVGWKYQKRPGVDYLLDSLVDHFELVIFTSESGFTAHPIIEKLDPQHFTMYQLYRDSTKYVEGHHVKDLSNLNRSLNRVIIVDTDLKSVKMQPENSIILDKWTGDIHDRTLYDIVPFLLTVANSNVTDVRPVLDYYRSIGASNIVEAFKINQAKLREDAERRQQLQRTVGSNQVGGAISTFSLGSATRHRQQQMEAAAMDTLNPPSPPPTSFAETKTDSSSTDESWSISGWIGSWVGWK